MEPIRLPLVAAEVAGGCAVVTFSHADLFSGIGGWGLAARRVGWNTRWFCEIEEYPVQVLHKNFPGVPVYGDIRELDLTTLPAVDILTGSPPCQPFSVAGSLGGWDDPRNLWPQMVAVVEALRPRWVLAENSPQFLQLGYDRIAAQMEDYGYTIEALVLPACAVGAPHERMRAWIIGFRDVPNPTGARLSNGRCGTLGTAGSTWVLEPERLGCSGATPNSLRTGHEEQHATAEPKESGQSSRGLAPGRMSSGGITQSGVRRMDDGLPGRMDRSWGRMNGWLDLPSPLTDGVSFRRQRLSALGNAIVPRIPELLFRWIMQVDAQAQV